MRGSQRMWPGERSPIPFSSTTPRGGRFCPARVGIGAVLLLVAGDLLGIARGADVTRPVELVSIEVAPPKATISDPRFGAQFIATGNYSDGSVRDLTAQVRWSTSDRAVIQIDSTGYARFVGEKSGTGSVLAALGDCSGRAEVHVARSPRGGSISFEHELLPALTKAGCNQGACHGTPTGKNGFRLSLRGFDPDLDWRTLTREASSRRINPLNPELSLILRKGTGEVPHEGGRRFLAGSLSYRIVLDWVSEGLKPEPAASPRVVRLDVLPANRTLDLPSQSQQLAVLARYTDGSQRDVTRLCRYSSTDEACAQVDENGRVTRLGRGEVVILAYLENQLTARTLVFRDQAAGLAWSDPPETNFVDHHLFAKLRHLRITPSELADDRTFARRVYFDLIGLPPTPGELHDFVADARPDKRARLIDDLLRRPEYVDFWTLKWVDRLGCNQRFVGQKGAFSYHRWVRDQVASNVPFDQFVRALLTAQGSNYTNPPASFYRRLRDPQEAAETVSQLFLGVRLQCARCHNHVAERWTQDDYYGFAAFFSQVKFKNGPQTYAIYNKEETVYLDTRGQVIHPRTNRTMPPRALAAETSPVASGVDRRVSLADWVTSPTNPYFARATVNRLWFHLFGRGIVEPVDDLRESNPPASAELLDALASDFVAHGFDARQTLRTILNSRTYQLSSAATASNAEDRRYFSHYPVRLLSAEQLLDAASRVTEVDERLFQLPPGTRAAQLPDGEFHHPFLRSFGQPPRAVACECERGTDSTLEQGLQIVGGRTLNEKIRTPGNRLGRLLASRATDEALVDELFEASLARLPSAEERRLALDRFRRAPAERRRAAEDLLWALLNHPEFLFQH